MPDVYLGNFSSSGGDQIFIKAPAVIIYENTSVCIGDSLFVGGGWQNSAGIYLDALNCDTIVQTTLDIIEVDTSVTAVGETLIANAVNAGYQWLDCSTWLPITGATGQLFQPSESGYYAVEVTQENCTDTSGCHYVLITCVNTKKEQFVNIYPNPAGSQIHIDTPGRVEPVEIRMINMLGVEVLKLSSKPCRETIIDASELKNGFYTLQIKNAASVTFKSILINR